MKLLLDTHILIWALLDDLSLSTKARQLIEDPGNDTCVSSVSYVEVAIKWSLGRGGLSCSAHDLSKYVNRCRLKVVNLTPAHAYTLEGLPWHHRDPFDRMLVAQALTEPMRLVTHDAVVARYSETIIHV